MTDKREVHFEDKRQNIFKGAGQTLGGETKPSRLVPTKLEDKTTGTVEPEGEPENLNIETTSQLPGDLAFNPFLASGDFCLLLITFPNSLDPDEDRQIVGPYLGPNCLTL